MTRMGRDPPILVLTHSVVCVRPLGADTEKPQASGRGVGNQETGTETSDADGEDTRCTQWGGEEGDGIMPDPCGAAETYREYPFQGQVEGSDANIYHVLCQPRSGHSWRL